MLFIETVSQLQIRLIKLAGRHEAISTICSILQERHGGGDSAPWELLSERLETQRHGLISLDEALETLGRCQLILPAEERGSPSQGPVPKRVEQILKRALAAGSWKEQNRLLEDSKQMLDNY